jgi:hypothetical protein
MRFGRSQGFITRTVVSKLSVCCINNWIQAEQIVVNSILLASGVCTTPPPAVVARSTAQYSSSMGAGQPELLLTASP